MQHMHGGTVGEMPTFSLLLAINAPVVIARILAPFNFFVGPREIAMIPLVGLLWYWVALSLERRSVITLTLVPLRIAVDIVLSISGGVLGLVGIAQFIARAKQLTFYGGTTLAWLWVIFLTGLYLAWSVALLLLFSSDLYRRLRGDPITTVRV